MTVKKAEGHGRAAAFRKNPIGRRHRILFEAFEPRLLLAAAPTGVVDIANRTEVVGWTYDPDTPATSLTVQIKVDGVANNVTASETRAGLVPFIGSANHGFTFATPALAPGNHTVVISAADSTSGALTVLKVVNLTNPAPRGAVDSITSGNVSGWAFDADAGATPISVRIDNDGSTVNTVSASNPRDGLTPVVGSPNHAFSVNGSFGVVDVYALDAPTGQAVLLGTNSVRATGFVDVLTTTRVAGWAWTPDLGSDAVGIEVDVDGVLFQTATANLPRAGLAGVTGPDHGFDFALNALAPGAHTVQVFALDSMSTSNAKVLLGSARLTNPAPIGFLDMANQNGVAGWAFDSNAGAGSISIQVKVDDVLTNTVTANLDRPGLTAVVGSPLHGFTAPLSNLSAGPHKIQIFAIDNPSGTAVLLATQFINNHLPFGSFDSANSFTLSGWAYDSDSPGTPVNVIVVLDGTSYPASPASVARAGLTAVLPDPNHAFSIATPTHLTGSHTVSVLAVDTFTGQQVSLGTKVFLNQAPRGNVDNFFPTNVSGWTYDPDAPATSISVLLRIDGNITAQAVANLSRPGLVPLIGSANHGFSISFARLATGSHFIEVFGVDAATGVSTLIGSKTIIV